MTPWTLDEAVSVSLVDQHFCAERMMSVATSVPATSRASHGRAIAFLFLSVLIASCGDGSTTPEEVAPTAAYVTITPVNVWVIIGATSQLTAVARESDGTAISNARVTWKSHTPTVATIDANGLVTALTKGSTSITATVDSQTASAAVYVRMPLAQLTTSSTEFAAAIGEPHTLELRALDVNHVLISGVNVTWTSSAPAVASVSSSNGSTAIVTALSSGTATISASAEGHTVSTAVTVGSVEQVAGIWDFVDEVSGTGSNPTCADSGSISFVQTGVILTGKAQQVGRCTLTGNTVRIERSLTVAPSQFNTNQIRFTLTAAPGSISCQYIGQLNADRTAMSGTVSCGGSTGSWSAVRARAVTSVVMGTTVAVDSLLRGATVDANVRMYSGADEVFLRPVTWSTTNATVATTTAATNANAAVIRAVNSGTATVSATVGDISATRTITVHAVTFTSVSVGVQRTCGTSTVGHVYCWAYDAPLRYFTGPTISALSVGAGVICGLGVDGVARCWKHDEPLPSDGIIRPIDTGVRFSSISAGGFEYYYYQFYSVPRVCALSIDGAPYCWGHELLPIVVPTAQRFSTISTGANHSCALDASGQAYCWGSNSAGELGDGSLQWREEPVAVATSVSFDSIYTGGNHSCALTAAGAAWCWGRNVDGELGVTTGPTGTRTPVDVSQGRSFRSLSLGLGFTCGLTTAGDVYCWGRNEHGQLGTGLSGLARMTPAPINSPEKFISIASSAAAQHTCGITTGQRVFCWGYAALLGVSSSGLRGPILLPGQH